MEDGKFSPEQSLQLIQSMIDNAKNSVADNSFYFLLWGWLVFAASVFQYILKVFFNSPYHYAAWSLMIVGIIVSVFYGYNSNKNRKVKTYVEELIDFLWIGIFVSYMGLSFIFSQIGWEHCSSFYMLLYPIGSFVTGKALKFSPLIWGAVGSWLLAVVAAFANFDLNILLGAMGILVSYIIPGYMLRNKYRRNLVNV